MDFSSMSSLNYPRRYYYYPISEPVLNEPVLNKPRLNVVPIDTQNSCGSDSSSDGKFLADSGSSSGHGDGDGDFDCIDGDFYGDLSGTFDESPSSFFGGTDKQTMQNLNGRLTNYLDKVRSLQASNIELEHKIREWYENKEGLRVTFMQRDYSIYYTTIDELRAKIFQCTTDKSKVILEVDNARLATEDFKLNYENELGTRRRVEVDINGLRKVLDQLTVSKSDLEIQAESLNDELAYLKKNHEEEMGEMGTKMGNQVSVEIDAAPGNDLTHILAEMRGKYEMMAAKNRREAEAKFIATSEKLQKDVLSNVEQVQSGKSEITELRRSLQGLEIDLQTQLSLKASLETSLSESECNYRAQLFQIQSTISGQEAQLTDLRSDMARQNHEYKTLLDVKNRLQMEINMYQQLIEGQDANFPSSSPTTNKSSMPRT